MNFGLINRIGTMDIVVFNRNRQGKPAFLIIQWCDLRTIRRHLAHFSRQEGVVKSKPCTGETP